MRRFERILNITDECYLEDITRIKKEIVEFKDLSDREIQYLYREYSTCYCAGWLILDDLGLEEFKRWALEEED